MSTISALGFSWITDSQPLPPATAAPPLTGQNMWLPANASSVNNQLQLTLQQNSGQYWYPASGIPQEIWASSQAVLDLNGSKLAYGKIVATVVPTGGWGPFIGGCTEADQNTSTTFGIFTFDPSAAAPFNEIDIVEIGYQNQNQSGAWINQQTGGPATTSDAQFAVQPWDAAIAGQPDWSQVHRIALDASLIPGSNEVTFMTDWQADSITFYAAYGKYTGKNFPVSDANTISWTIPAGATIPAPTATMSLYINLWPYGGPSTGNPVTFTVTHLEVPIS